MRRRRLSICVAAFLLSLAGTTTARAEEPAAPTAISRDAIRTDEGVELRTGWLYRPGDDLVWAETATVDADWELVGSPRLGLTATPVSGWTGIGWFRLHVTADESVVNTPLALILDHPGASEVFLDGKRIGGFGTVGATADVEQTFNPSGLPIAFQIKNAGDHVVAIRYSCTPSTTGVLPRNLSAGVNATLKDAESAIPEYARVLFLNVSINSVLATLMLGFGVLHLLLFWFHRRDKANLYYGLFGASFGVLIAVNYLRPALHVGYDTSLALVVIGRICVGAMFLSLVAFLRAAFAFTFGWWYRLLVVLWVAAVFASLMWPTLMIGFYGINGAIGFSVGAAMFTIGMALRYQLDGAWIIGLGANCIATALTSQLVAQIFGITAIWPQVIAVLGFFGLPVCISIFFARSVARTNRALETKLVEVESLSAQTLEHERQDAEIRIQREHDRAELAMLQAENDRKAKELDEARQLQLSMLPTTLPVIPGIEIAAYMKPATEVGGDYYDFHVGLDGTLTIAVGDATGHGLKAGTLVTATKGLFNAFAGDADIVATFHRSSLALKQLNLRYLYMALTLAKINGKTIRVGAAGMPPMLVWRAASGAVEEIMLPGLPLGGTARFPYEEREVTLSDGDVVVLMSDGFPERFNEVGEMIDYERAGSILTEAAGESPQTIIERFVAEGDAWAGVRPQDDDITFVVLRFGPQMNTD